MGFFSDVGSAITGGITSGISGGIESAIGAGASSLLGGAQGSVGIERTVRKAKRAGIHPLFALGYGGGYPEGGAQIMKGQASTGTTARDEAANAALAESRAKTGMWEAEAELARSKAMRIMQTPREDMGGSGLGPDIRGRMVPVPRRNPRRTLGNSKYYPNVPPPGKPVWLGGKKYMLLPGTSRAQEIEDITGDVASEILLAPYNIQDAVVADEVTRPGYQKRNYNVPSDAWGVY